MYLIDWMMNLNESWSFIFIGWGGLAPQGNPYTSLIYQESDLIRNQGAPVRPVLSACRSCIRHISLIQTPIWTFPI
jgi:hypothetical protein